MMAKTKIISYKTLVDSDDWTFKYLNEVTNQSNYLNEQSEIRETSNSHLIETVKLINLVDVNPDKINKDELSENEMFKYIDVSSISSDSGMIIEVKNMKGLDLPARARLLAREGDILLSTVRPDRNIVALVPPNCDGCIVNSTLAVLRLKKEVNGEILYLLLRSEWVQKILSIKARGTAIPTISIKVIKELEIPVTKSSLVERQEEAYYLYSNWIELNKLKRTFQNAIEDVFIDHNIIIENKVSELRNPIYKVFPYDHLEDRLDVGFYFDKTSSSVSHSVELVKLKELIKEVKSGSTPASEKYSEQGIPFIRIKDLDDKGLFIQTEDVLYINEDAATNYSKNTISKDNVLISKVGTVGKTALVQSEMEGAIINQHLAAVETNERILPEFLVYYLKTSWARLEFERRSGGSAQQFIKVQELEEIPIPLPPINEQKNIIDDIRQETSNKQIEKLEERISDFLKSLYLN